MSSTGSRGWIRTVGSFLPALFFGSIALVFTVLAMSQSYHFGLSLGVSEGGSLSMARWLSLIDLCTAALPIAAIAMLHRGYRWCAGGLFVVTLVYMAFSMTNQIGFAAAERLARSEKNRAIAVASSKAQADKSALISRHCLCLGRLRRDSDPPAAPIQRSGAEVAPRQGPLRDAQSQTSHPAPGWLP